MTDAPSLGDVVARQIRFYRRRRDMTIKQLAEECARLGAPQLSVASLTNIERGQSDDADGPKRRRREINIDELAVLARALLVPPLLLIFPVGQDEFVEIAPGSKLATWTAAMWFTGETSLLEQDDPTQWWTIPLILFRRHTQQSAAYADALEHKDLYESGILGSDPDDPTGAKSRGRASFLLRELRNTRAEIRRHGLMPPGLPPEMAHVDDRRYVFLTPDQAAQMPPGSVRPVNHRPSTEEQLYLRDPDLR